MDDDDNGNHNDSNNKKNKNNSHNNPNHNSNHNNQNNMKQARDIDYTTLKGTWRTKAMVRRQTLCWYAIASFRPPKARRLANPYEYV